jgi:hypothetical protein
MKQTTIKNVLKASMSKLLTILFLTLLTSCTITPPGLEYGIKNGEPFYNETIETLENKYKQIFPSVDLSQIQWYELPYRELNDNVCHGRFLAACIYTSHEAAFISDLYNTCETIAHEMMHAILAATENDPDGNHVHEYWSTILNDMCK